MEALIIVDVQYDFLPGGALGIDNSDEIIPVIQNLADNTSGLTGVVITTGDCHPKETKHFDKWPPHCIKGTKGALVHEEIFRSSECHIIKGTSEEDDGYSAFEGKDVFGHTLESILLEERVDTVVVCGLALDYCVKETAIDAAKLGFATIVPMNATAAVDPSKATEVVEELKTAGVVIA